MQHACPQSFVDLADRLGAAARASVLAHYRTALPVETKSDSSPVTAADRETETVLRELIADAFPAHGVLGEEHGPEQPDADYVWVIDPIDGTEAYICGIPVFCTLIALLEAGRPLLGLIEQPVTGERWLGARGRPTTLNGAPVGTRHCPDLHHARLCATTPNMFTEAEAASFARVARDARIVRYGADGYAYGALACGGVDLIIEADLDAYDYMAHVAVVAGAGGSITDWEGRELSLALGASRVVAAGDATLHARALRLLAAG